MRTTGDDGRAERAEAVLNAPHAPEERSGARRVTVTFSPDAYETVERLARRKGTTMSEVLRDAIQLASWLANAQDEGWRLLLEQHGRVREVVHP